MHRKYQANILVKGFGMLIVFSLIGCMQFATMSSPTPSENINGFSPEAYATLSSLEQVDDYPLYVMHYFGGYEIPVTVELSGKTTFACSLFAALGDKDNLLFGRNFDWSYGPALLLYTDPPGGYASVTMVSLSFSDFNQSSSRNLLEKALPEREPLLGTPLIPIDGMNEYGLVIGMAAVEESVSSNDPSKPTIGDLVIMRQVLDHAQDVNEAVDIFSQYNIDFTGGPPIHYLIADAHGRSVVIEYIAGQMTVLPNENAWHVATNHLLGNDFKGDGSSGWRYDTIENKLRTTNGKLTSAVAMELLSTVSQKFTATQWSVIYNISSGNINVAMATNYDAVHAFQLEMIHP